MLLLLSVKFGTSSRRRVFDRWSLGSDRKSFGEERAIVKVWSRIFIDTSVNFDVHCRFRTKKKCAECTGWIARDVWLTIDQGEWHFCKRNLAYYYTLLITSYISYLTRYFYWNTHLAGQKLTTFEGALFSCWAPGSPPDTGTERNAGRVTNLRHSYLRQSCSDPSVTCFFKSCHLVSMANTTDPLARNVRGTNPQVSTISQYSALRSIEHIQKMICWSSDALTEPFWGNHAEKGVRDAVLEREVLCSQCRGARGSRNGFENMRRTVRGQQQSVRVSMLDS